MLMRPSWPKRACACVRVARRPVGLPMGTEGGLGPAEEVGRSSTETGGADIVHVQLRHDLARRAQDTDTLCFRSFFVVFS